MADLVPEPAEEGEGARDVFEGFVEPVQPAEHPAETGLPDGELVVAGAAGVGATEASRQRRRCAGKEPRTRRRASSADRSSAVSAAYRRIKNRGTGRCLVVSGGGSENGARAAQFDCLPQNTDQIWDLPPFPGER
ncbi:hypothetical protein Amsp01_040070 [Amycolatopsis sp. NBRC 101858]|nr:hypothetical protein Amsp01_040070 [Amycolatopsis sp. NBRC 101858]